MRWMLLALFFALPLAAQPDMQLLRGSTEIASGGTDSIQNTGPSPFNITYTIRNDGTTDLDLTDMPPVALSAESNCTVIVLQDPAVTVGPAGTTTFRLQVSPIAATGFSFAVSIASNDTLQNPYTFTFNGNTSAPSKKSGSTTLQNDCSTGVRSGTVWIGLLAAGLLVLAARFPRLPTRRDRGHFVD
ncbi:MAG: hypothetical protein KF696_15135 [Planctomycetes bacterium]|nr:hypothetical protein [Planctomycetota bacterium]MCW8135902.1 hypothetical protein [Planctomycetota bacterium]